MLHSIPTFLRNYSRYREWFDAESIADIRAIIGDTYANLREADEALLAMIRDSERLDTGLFVQAMHRRQLRFSMIIAGTAPDSANPLFHRLDPILS